MQLDLCRIGYLLTSVVMKSIVIESVIRICQKWSYVYPRKTLFLNSSHTKLFFIHLFEIFLVLINNKIFDNLQDILYYSFVFSYYYIKIWMWYVARCYYYRSTMFCDISFREWKNTYRFKSNENLVFVKRLPSHYFLKWRYPSYMVTNTWICSIWCIWLTYISSRST